MLDVFQRGVQRNFHISSGKMDRDVIYIAPRIGLLLVRKVQKVLQLLIQPEIQTVFDTYGLDLSIKISIER